MKSSFAPSRQALAIAAVLCGLLATSAAQAQNIAIVNGKPVPKARLDALVKQAERAGQQVPAEAMAQAREQVVLREIFVQEAERRGIAASADFRSQMELARQSILIRELFDQERRSNPVSDADAQAEYNKFKAQASGTEYRASHILVEKEDEAKALLGQLKSGAKFEDLAKKHSKDPGSGANGGDLDFAKPDSYVPEFSAALVKLKKGETTEAPVKSQFGFHIIRLVDVREAPFPGFEEVKAQVKQRLEQQRLAEYQDRLRKAAKTDFKFGE
jgi:peptidyl-prolyl cis-trans isomerase C